MRFYHTRIRSGLLCFALLAAAVIGCTGCTGNTGPQTPPDLLYAPAEQPLPLGAGETTFPLTVTHLDGTQVEFIISTDAETVGTALEEVGLITGEQGPFGLMISAVNGETLIYEQHKAYWAFFVGDTYATSGVDVTLIENDVNYGLKGEPA